MKNVYFAIIALIVTTQAQANTVDFTEFKKAALSAEQAVPEGDGCKFKVENFDGGLKLEITGSTHATLVVGAGEEIQHSSKSSDGGVNTYRTHAGTFTVTFADDAFDRVDINTGAQKASCEVDF